MVSVPAQFHSVNIITIHYHYDILSFRARADVLRLRHRCGTKRNKSGHNEAQERDGSDTTTVQIRCNRPAKSPDSPEEALFNLIVKRKTQVKSLALAVSRQGKNFFLSVNLSVFSVSLW
jgi:hypothetical protein